MYKDAIHIKLTTVIWKRPYSVKFILLANIVCLAENMHKTIWKNFLLEISIFIDNNYGTKGKTLNYRN